ncbi:MAG: hypothetical protein J6W26_00200 [Bacteroidales bacterium]|nr:hypothetical protein [Bacteroidales bacterium]
MNINTFLKFKRLYMSLPGFMQKPIDDVRYRKGIKKALKLFLTKEEYGDEALKTEIIKDIKRCRKQYRTKPEEYFLFGFRNCSPEERAEFLPDVIKDNVLSKVVGFDVFSRELKDKFNFYKLAGGYFLRETMLVNCKGDDNLEEFKQFASKHHDLFIKSNVLSKGRGTGLYHVKNDHEAEGVYAMLGKIGGEWIVEEKIEQAHEMAQWNESSVNTVRLPAILNNGQWTVIGAFFRTGRKGSVVDNAGAGGIFACVDADSGALSSDGVDEAGVYYERHPDSGLKYKGWQIPRWEELLTLAKKIHCTMPHHKYVGWDFALTDKGWALVEGNWGQFVSQYNDHVGLKKRFFELMGVEE